MALIKCYECGNEISDKASSCPNCGAPVVVHKWRCSECGNMISEEPCPYCSNLYSNVNATTIEKSSTQSIAHKKSNSAFVKIVSGLIPLFLILAPFYNDWFGDFFESSYYIAKLPSISAAAVKVDGYMHKDKSCCQNVANAFGAEVIHVKPKSEAGTNEYGQSVSYKDAFYYCPLCCD